MAGVKLRTIGDGPGVGRRPVEAVDILLIPVFVRGGGPRGGYPSAPGVRRPWEDGVERYEGGYDRWPPLPCVLELAFRFIGIGGYMPPTGDMGELRFEE
jgi:hypothetical protein